MFFCARVMICSLFVVLTSGLGAMEDKIVNRAFLGLCEQASKQEYISGLQSLAQNLLLQDRILAVLRYSVQSDCLKYSLKDARRAQNLRHIDHVIQCCPDECARQRLEKMRLYELQPETVTLYDKSYGFIDKGFNVHLTTPKALGCLLLYADCFKHLNDMLLSKKLLSRKLIATWCSDENLEVQHLGKSLNFVLQFAQQEKLCDFISKLLIKISNTSKNISKGDASSLLTQLSKYREIVEKIENMSSCLSLQVYDAKEEKQLEEQAGCVCLLKQNVQQTKLACANQDFSVSTIEKRFTLKFEKLLGAYALVRSTCVDTYEAVIKEIKNIIQQERQAKNKFSSVINLYKYLNDFEGSRLPDVLDQSAYSEVIEILHYPDIQNILPNLDLPKKPGFCGTTQSHTPVANIQKNKQKKHGHQHTRKQNKKSGHAVSAAKRTPNRAAQQAQCSVSICPECVICPKVQEAVPLPIISQELAPVATQSSVVECQSQASVDGLTAAVESPVIQASACCACVEQSMSTSSIAPKTNASDECVLAVHADQICANQQNTLSERDLFLYQLSFIKPYQDGQLISDCAEFTVIKDPCNDMTITLLGNSGKRPANIRLPLNYTHNVQAWFNDARAALIDQNYLDPRYGFKYSPTKSTQKKAVLIHRFSKLVDAYILSKGIYRSEQSRRYLNCTNSTISIPGIIDYANGSRDYCVFQYIIDDRTGTCFHRNVLMRTNMQLTAEFMAQGFYDVEFPPLE